MSITRPVVLCFSGHDPSGGAGVQADIETLVSQHCHAASVITALTEQDSRNVKKLLPQNPEDIISQAETVLTDLDVKVFKIGLIGHHKIAEAIHAILQRHPHIPVVLDPVLAAGGGAEMSDRKLLEVIVDLLLPLTTVLTPNSQEARKLAGLEDLNECGLALLKKGCRYVLTTGAHETTPKVSNRLYHDGRRIETFHWDRLPESYHGSGCTLAACIAGLLAQGLTPAQAVYEAQEYTWNALQHGYLPGKGQHNPDRLFWMEAGV
ncbi:bifunctional hydroxymethylpyrimidine kinase/phosphomethylpyrimidine kinase [Methylomicrobium sp. RS1]|jgi:hydroxymethylpyrimidine/phosphomethylpyrimidine kinase|uniref:bifunctional hydroxymethylpyrimidine kinase/phosphomethylpyrimidine kinase n=1 Tax=Candidatus Methylomicrobium oryzae TaxID=2802053 RepID=UPI001921DE60|nr:hydroxymethylpyrimidine/phosphomethylpyrimidine kinase [Methylomicrobium sp. RS1]MBL1264186.1 hydroxymethylpyrimidine/phosphomethylpyrimidine kinase [Methylomicrobium sp. RS1]